MYYPHLGPSEHPDVLISRSLAWIQGLEQNYFQIHLPEVTECIKLLQERAGLTQAITPASTAVGRSAYGQLHHMGNGILDRGFGEVVRRQFMNRVVLERMLCGDLPDQPLSSPGAGKADIFTPEVHRAMVLAAKEQLHAAWQDVPASMTVADKVDLISIRSQLPNFFGFEQNCLDHVCVLHMPCAQPSVLRALFRVPLRLRWHGRLLRRLIRKHSPALSRIPLVKGTTQYPFGLGTVSTLAYTRAKKQLGFSYSDRCTQKFILHMREFLLDTLHSSSVRTCEIYDQTKLQHMADGLVQGDSRYTTQLGWWLAFDAWRRVLR